MHETDEEAALIDDFLATTSFDEERDWRKRDDLDHDDDEFRSLAKEDDSLEQRASAAVSAALIAVLPGIFADTASAGGRHALEALSIRAAGGPGSGNFGHSGRPGEVGGSAAVTFDGSNAAAWQSQSLGKMLSDLDDLTIVDPGVCVKKPNSDECEDGRSAEEVLGETIARGVLEGKYLPKEQQDFLAKAIVADIKREQQLDPLGAYVLAAVADNASTIQFLKNKTAHEANPAISWIEDPAAMLAVGAGMDAAAVWSWLKLTKDHKKVQKVGLYVAAIVRAGLALNNVALDERNRRRNEAPIPGIAPRPRVDSRRIVFQMRIMADGSFRTLADDPIFRMKFDAKNPSVIAWASKHATELVTNILETTREKIRIAVEELQEDGDFEFAHDRILAAIGDEERADLIARHETMLAAGEGQRLAWEQAEDAGLMTGKERREWIVTDDERLCPECAELSGTTAPLNGTYPGGYDGPPAHVQCRCTEGIIG